MAQMVINIPDNIANRVVNAFAKVHGWSGTFDETPETKVQFMKRTTIRFIIDSIKRSERDDASSAAQSAVDQSIINDIVLD